MFKKYTRLSSVARTFFSCIFLSLFFPITTQAQLVVTPNVGSAALVNSLVGMGMTVSNITLNCAGNAYGTFSNGNTTNIGLTNGILLTSGSATNAIGPNNSASAGTCNGTSAVDPQLTTLDPLATNDPCILEFDVVPQCNTLQIRFVFGSEEYPEFVSSGFNDAFGFWISGPGPACQSGFYNNTNVATLPNNTTIVSIDNVNPSTNNAYYVDNTGGTTIQYDGFTTVLTRNISLCPCQTYHWKLAIADAGDCNYDSGVFIDFLTCSNALTATTSSVNSVCSSCNGTASVVASGVGPFTYSWSPSGGNAATATGLCPGTYTCTIDDAVSCSPAYTVAVTVGLTGGLAIAPTQTNPTCNGGSNGTATVVPSGGTSPYTYSWSPTGGTNATATGLSAGTYTCTIVDANGCSSTQTFTITQPTAVTAGPSQTNVLCNGGNNGTATVVASGGTPGYTYAWTPSGGNAATASGLSPGTYTCTVTDANGCTTTQSFTITQPTALTASSSSTNNTCFGGATGTASVTPAGGTPGYTYSWAPSGGNAATASGLTAGTYTCTITDANGCITTQSVTITQPPQLTSAFTQTDVLCNGGATGSATVTPSGGTPGYTYSWAPSGGNAATASGLSAGTYTCTITDANGCTATQAVTINQPTALACSVSIVNASCSTPGSATATPSGGTAPYSYSWSSGGTAATENNLSAGTYTVTITDANGCVTTQTATLTSTSPVTSTATFANNSCFGGSTGTATVTPAGGASPYTYSWSPSGGTNATATGLAAGTYTCTITDANGCLATQTVTITDPPQLTATSSQTNVTCNGGTNGTGSVVASGGTSGYTYSWSPAGGNGATTIGVGAGTYTVTITDANGCTTTQSVTITQPTALTCSVSVVNAGCLSPGSATATPSGGTGPYTFSWSSGGTAATENNLNAGTYTVTITDANGCITTQTATIQNASPMTATAIFSNISCFGGANGSATVSPTGGTSPYTYSWSPSGGTNATATGLAAGTYTCTITDANGCTTTQTVTITAPTQLTAAPSHTNVLCNGQSNGSGTVVAAGGTPGYTYAWLPSGGSGASASGLGAGSYTCTITDANGCTTTQSVVVTQPNALALIANSTATCPGDPVQIIATGSGGTSPYSYSWSNGPTSASQNVVVNSTTSYTCTITDANGCTSTAVSTVTANPVPSASITTNATNGVYVVTPSGQLCFYGPTTGVSTWTWMLQSGTSNVQSPCVNITAADTGSFCATLIVQNAQGCADTAVTCVEVTDVYYSIPNVFTPNGDGTNDAFIITNNGMKSLHCMIYDRWGVMVYEWDSTTGNWDGKTKSGNEAVDGVYYWVLNMEDFSGKTYADHGFVHLIRGTK